jgi:agmatine deiminase
VIWLPGLSPRFDYITDGHIDGIACFARPGEVIFSSCVGGDHPLSKFDVDYMEAMAANRRALETAVDARGRTLRIIELPEGSDALNLTLAKRTKGEFCCSYVNFYMPTGGIIAPAFGVPSDDTAAMILRDIFPDREILMVDIIGIACGGGGIHCVTQQQPRRLSVPAPAPVLDPPTAAIAHLER